MSVKRIHWDQVDKLAVAEATIHHQRIYPGSSILRSVRAAQDVLPPEKHRNLRTTDDIGAWISEFMQLAQAMIDKRKQAETPPEAPESTPVAPSDPEIPLLEMPLEKLTELWLGRFFDEYLAPKIEAKADELFTAKTLLLIDQINVLQGKKSRLHLQVPEDIRRAVQMRVLIFGLIGSQVTRIKKDFGDKLDLTFAEASVNTDSLIGLSKNTDVGIIMTRFVDHSRREHLRDNAPHTVMVSGSTSDLSNILTSIVNEGKGKVIQHNFNNKIFNG
jgi:hypothetical protein